MRDDTSVSKFDMVSERPSNFRLCRSLVFDEAHRLRNPHTAGSQAATELSDKAKNLLLLTGTPITNSPTDLAPLLSMLRREKITPEQSEKDYIGHRKVYPTWLSHLTGADVGEEGYVKNEDDLREKLKGLVHYQPSKTYTTKFKAR
jgi:hypothetical protein